MKLLASKVHIQGMEVSLADKVHKQEPHHVAKHFTHATIPISARNLFTYRLDNESRCQWEFRSPWKSSNR